MLVILKCLFSLFSFGEKPICIYTNWEPVCAPLSQLSATCKQKGASQHLKELKESERLKYKTRNKGMVTKDKVGCKCKLYEL